MKQLTDTMQIGGLEIRGRIVMPPSTTITTTKVELRMPLLVKAKEEVERVALAQAYSAPATPAKKAE